MSKELLNVDLVEEIRKSRGVSKTWLWKTHLGLKRTHGFALLKNGLLPDDAEVRAHIIRKLAEFTGKDAADLLLTYAATAVKRPA